MYKLNEFGNVIRLSDGAVIPNDPKNRNWIEYQIWLDEGGEPEPADQKVALVDSATGKQSLLEELDRADTIDDLKSVIRKMLK